MIALKVFKYKIYEWCIETILEKFLLNFNQLDIVPGLHVIEGMVFKSAKYIGKAEPSSLGLMGYPRDYFLNREVVLFDVTVEQRVPIFWYGLIALRITYEVDGRTHHVLISPSSWVFYK